MVNTKTKKKSLWTRLLRFLKVSLFLLGTAFFLTASASVEAAETAQQDTAAVVEINAGAPGLHVYLFPAHGGELSDGSFWLYAEMIDQQGVPRTEALELNASIHLDQKPEEEGYQSMIEPAFEAMGSGYGTDNFLLQLSDNKYSYTLDITVKDGEEELAGLSYDLLMLYTPYPKLLKDSAEQIIKRKEDCSEKAAININWSDMSLFHRLFVVDPKVKGKLNLNLEEAEDCICVYTADKEGSGEIDITFIDLRGESYTLPYNLSVSREKLPQGMILLGALAVVLMSLAMGASYMLLQHRRGQEIARSHVKVAAVGEALQKKAFARGKEGDETEEFQTLLSRFAELKAQIDDLALVYQQLKEQTCRKIKELNIDDTTYLSICKEERRKELEFNYKAVQEAYRTYRILGKDYYEMKASTSSLTELKNFYERGIASFRAYLEELEMKYKPLAPQDRWLAWDAILKIRLQGARPMDFVLRKGQANAGRIDAIRDLRSNYKVEELCPLLIGTCVANGEGGTLHFTFGSSLGDRVLDGNQAVMEVSLLAGQKKRLLLCGEDRKVIGELFLSVR